MSRRTVIATLGLTAVGAFALFSKKNPHVKTSFPPAPREVNGCTLDEARLRPLAPCMECCGPKQPRDEWNHSCSPLTDEGRGWEAIAVSIEDEANSMPGVSVYPNMSKEQIEKHLEGQRALRENERKEQEQRADRWRAFIAWFRSQKELVDTSFVLIGEDRLSDTNFGCDFPRPVVGLTAAGSLVGLAGYAVQT